MKKREDPKILPRGESRSNPKYGARCTVREELPCPFSHLQYGPWRPYSYLWRSPWKSGIAPFRCCFLMPAFYISEAVVLFFRDSLRGLSHWDLAERLCVPVGIESAVLAVKLVGFVVYGADAERYTAAAGAPQCVEQAFVMAEEKEIDAAECDGRESDSRTFVRDYGQQADYQGEEKERQAQRVNRLITQVPLIPERQRGAHARYGRDAADADQQEIVVHDKYRNACPPAYVSGSLG